MSQTESCEKDLYNEWAHNPLLPGRRLTLLLGTMKSVSYSAESLGNWGKWVLVMDKKVMVTSILPFGGCKCHF